MNSIKTKWLKSLALIVLIMKGDDISIHHLIIFIVVVSIQFLIGMYLQIRIIKRVRQAKTTPWETQVYHSVVLIIHFSFGICFETLTYTIPNITHYTGGLFCDLLWFIKYWGIFAIQFHSLSVSVHKYIVIVYRKGMDSGNNGTEKLLFWSFLSLPIIWSIGMIPRFTTLQYIIPAMQRCYGVKEYVPRSSVQTNEQHDNASLFCRFQDNSDNNDGFHYFIYFITEIYCGGHFIVTGIININILEFILYFKIFRFINR